jgi:hypothetical protein
MPRCAPKWLRRRGLSERDAAERTYGIKFALLVAAGVALVAAIPALLGPPRAEAPASVAEANPMLAQPQEAAEATR